MIVLGADMHKSSHTIAAVGATSGELLGERTIAVGDRGFAAALDWARRAKPCCATSRLDGSRGFQGPHTL
jgi:hypothetical protein